MCQMASPTEIFKDLQRMSNEGVNMIGQHETWPAAHVSSFDTDDH